MTKGAFFMRGDTNPYCPAATQIVLAVPALSALRLSSWLGIVPSTLVRWAERAGITEERHVIRSVRPCGYGCCAAAVRMIWTPEISKRMAGRWLGVADSTVTRWAAEAGLDPRVNRRPDKQISAKAVREAWLDKSVTIEDASKRLGLSSRALYERALAMDLPARQPGVPAREWPADFDQMWLAGVLTSEMARACKRAAKSHITLEAQKRGLPARGPGPKKGALTLEGFAEMKLLESMRAQAALERENWKRKYSTGGQNENRSAA